MKFKTEKMPKIKLKLSKKLDKKLIIMYRSLTIKVNNN